MDSYPDRNPFPNQSVATIEENIDPGLLREWVMRTPTALLRGVKKIRSLADDYVDQFVPVGQRGEGDVGPLGEGSAGSSRGTVACLYGAHGTGKTHAVRYMLASVASRDSRPGAESVSETATASETESTPAEPVLLYLKLQETDFVEEYRRLLAQLKQPTLIDLTLRYLGTLASEQANQWKPPEWQYDIRDEVRDDPARVLALFSAHLVDAGEVLEAQKREIADVARGADYFQRALTFLLRPDQADDAYAWLCGQEISAASARRLGVSRQLSDLETCKYGLQLLATLVTRAGQPLVLVFDQCETF